ncbi:MAG: InlB B-repeat-containing protein, partial [Clostridia bacterium]|nr:InlB B-repeat-containing protein [Clostridia bacterium]
YVTNDGEFVNDLYKTSAQDITLYAYFTPITYQIAYELTNGTLGENSPTSAVYDTWFDVPTPTKRGYFFKGWTTSSEEFNKDVARVINGQTEQGWNGETAIGGDEGQEKVTLKNLTTTFGAVITLTAVWEADPNTPYTVEHYLMNTDGQGYTLFETENLKGIVDTEITPDVKTYQGFTSPQPQTVMLTLDPETVVKYYYTRNQYTVTLEVYGNCLGITKLSGAGTYYYGAEVTAKVDTMKAGYIFNGWTGDMTSLEQTLVFNMPAKNITLYADAVIPVPENLKFSIKIEGGIAIVEKYEGTEANIVIPETISYDTTNKKATTGSDYVVKVVYNSAFQGNAYVESISLPQTIEEIGTFAFADCEKLTTIEIKSTTLTVGEFAFSSSTNDGDLGKTIYVNDPNILKDIVKSSNYESDETGESSYGNLLVGVENLYIATSITDLSDFIEEAFTKGEAKVHYRDVDYYLYTRNRTRTLNLARREEDFDDDPLSEIEILY